jgi:hypothetical protein
MNKGKKSKKMMAGGRAGMKKMQAGGSANDPLMVTDQQMKLMKKIVGKTKGKISNKELELFMKSLPKLKSSTAAKKIKKADKPISEKNKRMVISKKAGGRTGVKKMMGGGRSGPVKMMKGGDPLSPRGAKMGMVMSPSKNKGKGLYGK